MYHLRVIREYDFSKKATQGSHRYGFSGGILSNSVNREGIDGEGEDELVRRRYSIYLCQVASG